MANIEVSEAIDNLLQSTPSTAVTTTQALAALGAVTTGGALGTPITGTLTNATGLPIVAGTSGTLTVARGGTGATTAATARTALELGTAATAASTDFQATMKGVIVTTATGVRTAYPPSADTDTARGLALEAAFAATVAGDTVDLSPGNYLITKAYSGSTVGGFVSDFAILDKMTICLNGARLYRNTPSTVTAGSFVIGRHYTIISAGTTNYVSEQSAANNNSGTSFTAIAVGTGDGTAILTPPIMFSVAHVTAVMGGSDWSLIGPGIIEGTAATTTTTGYTNEIGLNVNASRRWRINGVSFIKFRGTGLQLNSANFTGDATGYSAGQKYSTGHISNCNFDLNNLGMGCYAGNEYSAFTNCSFNQNLTGADVYAGNTKFVACEISNNTSYGIRIRNGGNDGHGCFVGGWLTHNSGFAVSAEASMDSGFMFTGSTFGADSATTNKIQSLGGGLTFVGCYVESPFFASATPTGINVMKNCFIAGTYTAITDLSAVERAKWKFVNNHTLTGVFASDDIRTTYATDADAGTGGVLQGEPWQQTTTGAMFIKL
jgi:hypothetical protein